MDIAIVGSGYVGLVTGACLAKVGHRVVCIDKDSKKIEALQAGRAPFYEPGLDDLVAEQHKSGRLTFSTDIQNAADARFVFLASGTPSDPDGRADLKTLLDSARELAAHLSPQTIVIVKATVPVGTCERIQEILSACARPNSPAVRVASNPEFLAEGRAIKDCLEPERIVIGTSDPEVETALRALYAAFDPTGERTLVMDVRSAELAKYACNALLASRISMVNELGRLAGKLAADIAAVCQVMRTDPRIGSHYLQPGVGYGGSCLPKDVKALTALARDHNEPAHMLN